MQTHYTHQSLERGFTLYELLLAFALSSMLIAVVSTVGHQYMVSAHHTSAHSDMQRVVRASASFIQGSINEAESVLAPTPGTNTTVLTLRMSDAMRDPTTISLVDGGIQVVEGVQPAIMLTTTDIAVSALVFQNLAYPSTIDSIQVSFVVAPADSVVPHRSFGTTSVQFTSSCMRP